MPRCKAVSFDANRFDLVKTTTLASGCRHKCCNNYPIYAIKLIPSVISFDFTYYRIIATKSEILSVFAEASFRISQQKKKSNKPNACIKNQCVRVEHIWLHGCTPHTRICIWGIEEGKIVHSSSVSLCHNPEPKKCSRKWLPVWADRRFEKCLYAVVWDFQISFLSVHSDMGRREKRKKNKKWNWKWKRCSGKVGSDKLMLYIEVGASSSSEEKNERRI